MMDDSLQITGEQFFDEYILIAPGSDYGRAMWSDIEKLEHGTILESAMTSTSRVLSLLHHIHFSIAINRKMHLPFQSIWRRLYSLESVQLDPDKRYCVIYTDVSAVRTDCMYLAEKKKEKNIMMVLIMVNTMARRGSLRYILSTGKIAKSMVSFIIQRIILWLAWIRITILPRMLFL